MFCREQAAQLRGRLDDIRALGAELVVVGNGSVAHARAFADAQGLDCPVFTDPGRETYAAAGLRRSVGSSVNLRTMRHAARARKRGHRQGAVQGDAWQQGGVLVIATGGEILFRYVSREAGDHPEPDDLLEVLRESVA